MIDVETLKNRLAEAQKAQKDNESAVMRAEIAQEQAKNKILEATTRLKDLGYTSVAEAESRIAELEQEIKENLDKAAKILDLSA